MGVVSFIDRDYWALNTSLYVTDFRGNDVKFIYYLLSTVNFRQFDTGSAQASLNRNLVYPHHVKVPPSVVEQKAIAQTLSAIDGRIELLRKTNLTLEAIAQTLFKSWFVDYDPVRAKQEGRELEGVSVATGSLFPNEFAESELGLIPRGWSVGVLGDVLSLRVERTKPNAETRSLPYVPIESIGTRNPFLEEFKSGEFANSSLTLFRRGDILFGAMRPYFHKVCVAPFDGVTRTTVFVLSPVKDDVQAFSLFRAFEQSTVDFATQHSEGSTIPYAKWRGSFELMPIVVPPEPVQRAFNDVVSSHIQLANSNIKQILVLKELRDTLLPRLISGQLRLPEAEALVC
ncbi:hypothetical protein WS71_12320 [Burkholderia mayonis]|uniref:Type I restriction modification DNA specificity domain-containing protein n=2 Tax=Burkholderia mayonis TaxID=1385591 RepID=A0A1B4FX54_9BURK|nr:hypothetical protein WS71_12320 [Burkholderia mayonis]KVE54622.1 hypothetical protein WS71_04160 [Burkholderia mayonis]